MFSCMQENTGKSQISAPESGSFLEAGKNGVTKAILRDATSEIDYETKMSREPQQTNNHLTIYGLGLVA